MVESETSLLPFGGTGIATSFSIGIPLSADIAGGMKGSSSLT
jgi:hypothetical protein